jgi:hypothetical protein
MPDNLHGVDENRRQGKTLMTPDVELLALDLHESENSMIR